ncbi:MAG: Uma2 family endonuclease [Acidobacteriota bacterium]|jgi:Uma2 family endonuclease|nr:Uma2 family endonuclease [Acidobacteriota bacterium]
MGLAQRKPESKRKYTIGEYLEMERDAFERSEYIDGYIYAMAGESEDHGIVSVNLISEIHQQLKKTDCQARVKDAKIQSGDFAKMVGKSLKGMFSYPDIVIFCGKPEFHDEHTDIIINPKVIIEVLSPSTELFDRNTKFHRLSKFNETLTDYILVSQDKPMVEHFVRQSDGNWKLFAYFGTDEIFKIKNIKCELKLEDIYDRIEFSKEAMEFLSDIKNAE